jgi:hypothetical protein
MGLVLSRDAFLYDGINARSRSVKVADNRADKRRDDTSWIFNQAQWLSKEPTSLDSEVIADVQEYQTPIQLRSASHCR